MTSVNGDKSVCSQLSDADLKEEQLASEAKTKRTQLDRFRELQKRRELQCKHSTSRRIDDIKESLAAKIKDEFSNSDELAALQQHNVDLATFDSKPKRRKKMRHVDDKKKTETDEGTMTAGTSEVETRWEGVRQFIDVNKHLSEKTGGSDAPQSRLELTISKAVALQEYEMAEQLSDRLAAREFGTKVAEAFAAKKFTEKRKQEEMMKDAKKKKKLGWGFEHKKRWETKGNM